MIELKKDLDVASCIIDAYDNLPQEIKKGIDPKQDLIGRFTDGEIYIDRYTKPSMNPEIYQIQIFTLKEKIDNIKLWYEV